MLILMRDDIIDFKCELDKILLKRSRFGERGLFIIRVFE